MPLRAGNQVPGVRKQDPASCLEEAGVSSQSLGFTCTPFTVPVLSPTVPVPTCATGLESSGSVSAQHSKAFEDLTKSNLGSQLLTANKSSCLWGSLGREEATGWRQLAQ